MFPRRAHSGDALVEGPRRNKSAPWPKMDGQTQMLSRGPETSPCRSACPTPNEHQTAGQRGRWYWNKTCFWKCLCVFLGDILSCQNDLKCSKFATYHDLIIFRPHCHSCFLLQSRKDGWRYFRLGIDSCSPRVLAIVSCTGSARQKTGSG